jgi:RNA recognition motif-containing protein
MISRQIRISPTLMEIVKLTQIDRLANVRIWIRKYSLWSVRLVPSIFPRENIDAKVYVRNIPTKKATDQELLNFFKPFGKISGLEASFEHVDDSLTR